MEGEGGWRGGERQHMQQHTHKHPGVDPRGGDVGGGSAVGGRWRRVQEPPPPEVVPLAAGLPPNEFPLVYCVVHGYHTVTVNMRVCPAFTVSVNMVQIPRSPYNTTYGDRGIWPIFTATVSYCRVGCSIFTVTVNMDMFPRSP